ncbi:antiactivator of flagellar biosynthesis FleN protein [Massilia arenosa]|uniref:Antiactivator of flagellar biosynthesis FleN protein n=1 Tax=Zemynaea arenosa TaxID=2561931 RepID=A0A4Y9SX62_9BURK|nr:antiactivator of flagellar biosynthesis FleN protein [Massilia arenosa]TFW29929.1 antiactivator of flagellar biosynthesis FleN protein [Massilia arenosa]
MANFDFDQAEGLRRMLAGPKPRIVTFLCATPQDDKGAMLVNLAASLVRSGSDVLLVDACEKDYGVAQRLGVDKGPSLLHVARQECGLNQVVNAVPQGFGVATMARGPHRRAEDARRLAKTFDVLVKQAGVVLVDGELTDDDSFPVPVMAHSEIVIQVGTSAASIKAAYALIKRISQAYGRRPFGLLVTGATEAQAKVVYDNMASAATRYLAVQLTSLGSVPADEYLHRAARLGRAVVDAFPLAGASVAFRRLAGKFALAGMAGRAAGSSQLGT